MIEELCWGFENVLPKKKTVLNPRPPIPETNWKRPKGFPSLQGANKISLDLETFDPDLLEYGPGAFRNAGHIVGASISTDHGVVGYWPMRHTEEAADNFDPDDVLRWLRKELRGPQLKVGFNLLYDIQWLHHEGVITEGPMWDCWIAEKLIYHQNDSTLESTAQRYLGEGKSSDDLYRWLWGYYGRGKNPTEKELRSMIAHVGKAPPRLVGAYAESDTTLPLEIQRCQEPILEKMELMDVFRMENKLLPLLVRMRQAGVSVDIAAAERADVTFSRSIDELQREVEHIAGCKFNTGSSDEVGRVFDKLGIRYNLTEKTQKCSIKSEHMEKVDHPIAEKMMELADLKKFRGSFIQNSILGSSVNGKIHTQLNTLRAVTGRMSSSAPNLQQIPSRSELSKVVRSIFIPDTDHFCWRSYDYASIESRVLAHYATGMGSEELRAEYNNNPKTDYHDFTIALVKRVTGFEILRPHAKTINFGLCYGSSEQKLAKMIGITKLEAEPLFAAFHDGLPYVKETMSMCSREAETHGFTRTIMGRRSHFDMWQPMGSKGEAFSFDRALSVYGTRICRAYLYKALNHKVQGTASELMKAYLVKCWEDGIFDATTIPRLVVHDSAEFSCPDDTAARREAFRAMKEVMENAIKFKVPIRADGKWGPNWNDLYKLDH